MPHVVLRAQLFVEVGARTVVPDPLSGALPLGDNVGQVISETEVPQFVPVAKKALVPSVPSYL